MKSSLPLPTVSALSLLPVLFSASAAYAQAEQIPIQEPGNVEKKSSAETRPVQQVTVSGARSESEERRQSTAGKIIIGREELDRNGDTSLGEIMKRLPGVTTGGRPGRGGEIRMRGMGGGYTQVLLNGERPPRGFSMESLSPDQVERIEIIRGAVAEFSTQAIAGTINIVLREEYKQKNSDFKLSLGSEQGRLASTVSFTVPGEVGVWGYALNGSVAQNRQSDVSDTDSDNRNASNNTRLSQHLHTDTQRHSSNLNLAPRLNAKFEDGDTLMFQPFIVHNRTDSTGTTKITTLFRSPDWKEAEPYAQAQFQSHTESTFLRSMGNWQHKFDDQSRLTLRFGFGGGQSSGETLRAQYDLTGKLINLINDTHSTRDMGMNTGGKYTQRYAEDHTLSVGWEVEARQRSQTRISLNNGVAQFAESGENLDANTRRLAIFAQDEFDINTQFSAYAGLRWEGIRTASSSAGKPIENTSRVLSPIVHGVWRLSKSSRDQIRLGLTSTYRAPELSDMIAVPSISSLNGPTRPDRTGNPQLKPELSRGIDLAYEHYLGRAGLVSANVFMRDIRDLIRRQTVPIQTPIEVRWVSSPLNIGHANTRGIELEAKVQLQELFEQAPALDLRTNYSRFKSSVDGIPGPYNRLDQQPPQTANLGVDYRLSSLPLTLGGNLNWTPAYFVQSSQSQVNRVDMKKQLDAYLLWKVMPDLRLRLSANNLLPRDAYSAGQLNLGGFNTNDVSMSPTYTTWTLRLELKI